MTSPNLKLVAASRTRLSDHVMRQLLDMIARRRLKPGAALPSESELARQFGVSKPVVREALGRLAAMGTVAIRQGRPTTVAALSSGPLTEFFELAVEMSDEGLREAIELRRALETEIAVLAAQRATPDDVAELAALIEAMRDSVETLEPWAEADIAFHLALARTSRNALMRFLMEALGGTMRHCIRQLQIQRDLRNTAGTLNRHVAIFDAVKARDTTAARAAMNAHFDASRDVVAAILADRSRVASLGDGRATRRRRPTSR